MNEPLGRRRFLDWIFWIRTRLLLVNVLIVAVPLAGVGFARFYEREMLRELEADMIHQAELVRGFVGDDPAGLRLSERGPLLALTARETRTRIRLLGPAAQVLADSHADGPPEGPEQDPEGIFGRAMQKAEMRIVERHAAHPPEAPDFSSRQEVVSALSGRYGAATRFWESRNTLYLFSALPVTKDGKIEGVVYVTRSTNPVRAAMYRLRKSLFWVLLAALTATVVLSIFLAGTISRPLRRLTRVAERIAAGDRTDRLTLSRRDEVGQLARAFDTMERKLDERARSMAELSADISHEFKSPLAGIRGAAELLLEGAADDPAARRRFLENILADAHRLDRLVTRLLELSRAEADTVPHEVFDYEALVRDVASRTPGAAPIEARYQAKRTQIAGRRAQIASVLGNLLDNAEQHAAPGTSVFVSVVEVPGDVLRTVVENRGPIIREAHLARIWERFFTTRADQGGTGLGLPIVKAVVEAHGGTVSVVSADSCTRFVFDFPVRK
jgi:two-component system sensor histidine kinase ChvG